MTKEPGVSQAQPVPLTASRTFVKDRQGRRLQWLHEHPAGLALKARDSTVTSKACYRYACLLVVMANGSSYQAYMEEVVARSVRRSADINASFASQMEQLRASHRVQLRMARPVRSCLSLSTCTGISSVRVGAAACTAVAV